MGDDRSRVRCARASAANVGNRIELLVPLRLSRSHFTSFRFLEESCSKRSSSLQDGGGASPRFARQSLAAHFAVARPHNPSANIIRGSASKRPGRVSGDGTGPMAARRSDSLCRGADNPEGGWTGQGGRSERTRRCRRTSGRLEARRRHTLWDGRNGEDTAVQGARLGGESRSGTQSGQEAVEDEVRPKISWTGHPCESQSPENPY